MSVLDKLQAVAGQYQMLLEAGEDPFGVTMSEILSATRAVVNGRETVLAGTNNYLGLTFDEACIRASKEALDKEGTGTTGSRFANGTYAGHRALERALADFLGFKHGIVFSTGYQANLGAISGLVGPGDAILLDADCHACIYDGCRLSGATMVRFRHNNPGDLDKRLARLGPETKGKLVIVEGIYSMFGDVAPLKELTEVAHKHGAQIYVDEAHSFGVFGENGRGVSEAAGIIDKIDFYSGTFSKSLGAIGGYCVSNHDLFELLRAVSRPYMFTASISPATVAGVREAVNQIAKRPQLRRALWANAERLHAAVVAMGFDVCAGMGPIIALRMPDVIAAVQGWNSLIRDGVYVNLAISPGTPDNSSLLRMSVSAAHTADDLDRIIAAVGRLAPAEERIAVAAGA